MNVKFIKSKLMAAFSLIELMVVIAIVALLTAIAVPAYQGYLQQSKVAEIFSLASDQMNRWQQQSNITAGFLPVYNTSQVGAYIASIELVPGFYAGVQPTPQTPNCTNGQYGVVCIALVASTGIDPSLDNVTLMFVPNEISPTTGDPTNITVTWQCYFAGSSNNTTATSLLKPGNCTPY